MEIQGQIIAILPAQSGTSKNGNNWMNQEYVIETHEQYPKRVCFKVFGEDKIKQFNIQVGQELKVSFDINSREYQGKWYNDVQAWKVEAATAQAPAAPAAPAEITPRQQAPVNFDANGQGDFPF